MPSAPTEPTVHHPKRIGIVDDHTSLILGLQALLAATDDLAVMATGATVPELLAHQQKLDLVLLDLRLSDGSTPKQNIEQLRASGVEALVFTSGDDPFLIRNAARAEVLGVVIKSASPQATLEAIRRAAKGEHVLGYEWAAAIDGDPTLAAAGLSPQLARVLEQYASGRSAGQVGRALHLSEDTVNDYLGRIRRKYAELGRPAPTKVDLYMRAVEDGYLPTPRNAGN